MSGDKLEVRASRAVRPLLRQWKLQYQQNPQSAEALTYQTVRSAVERVLSNPDIAGAAKFRMHAPLVSLCRLKTGPASRYRIVYITSVAHGKSIILWVGFRKDGDRRDVYRVLQRMIDADEFDENFAELGIKPPKS